MERRLRRLEQQGAELRDDVDAARRDAAAARVLAAGADRDVSDVRVELRELWEGQRELREEMRAGFAAIESKFAVVNSGLRQIITLLDDRPSGS